MTRQEAKNIALELLKYIPVYRVIGRHHVNSYTGETFMPLYSVERRKNNGEFPPPPADIVWRDDEIEFWTTDSLRPWYTGS